MTMTMVLLVEIRDDVEDDDLLGRRGYTMMMVMVMTMIMHTCKKRVMLRGGYFGQNKFAEKVRKSRQNVDRDKSA